MSYSSYRLPQGAPREGNRLVTVQLTLLPGQVASVLPVSDINKLSRVASVLVDATRAYSGFELIFSDTQRRIVVPSGSESCHRTFSADGAFTVRNLDAQYNAIFRAWLFSCPQPVYERFPGAAMQGDVIANARAGEFAINPGGQVATSAYAAPAIPPGTIWDSTQANPNVVLSNNGLTATIGGSPGFIRTPSYRSSGKFYFEFGVIWAGGGTGGPGFANASQGLGISPYADLFMDPYGNVYLSGSNIGKIGSWGNENSQSRSAMAVDIDRGLLWYNLGGNSWAGAGGAAGDPAAGTGGFDMSALPKPWALTLAKHNSDGPYSMTLYTGASSIGGGVIRAVPAGFQPGWPAV